MSGTTRSCDAESSLICPGLDTLCLPENRATPIPLVNHHCPIILAFWWYTPFPDTHDTKPKIFIESACGNTFCAAPTHIKPQPGSFTVEVVKVRVHVITHAIMFTRVMIKEFLGLPYYQDKLNCMPAASEALHRTCFSFCCA